MLDDHTDPPPPRTRAAHGYVAPTGGVDRNMRKCKGCGIKFKTKRIDQEFHDRACAARWWGIARVRGGAVYALLIQWRVTRKMKGGRKGFISTLAHQVDEWIIEDRENAKRKAP